MTHRIGLDRKYISYSNKVHSVDESMIFIALLFINYNGYLIFLMHIPDKMVCDLSVKLFYILSINVTFPCSVIIIMYPSNIILINCSYVNISYNNSVCIHNSSHQLIQQLRLLFPKYMVQITKSEIKYY